MDALKTPGPVLLIPNHVSWLDWLFLFVLLDDDWKCVVSKTSAQTSWLHRKIMLNRRTFPIDTTSPFAVKQMAEHLSANGRLVLFAEGRLSRTGTLMKLFEGTGFLLYKTDAKIITCYLRGALRLPLSPNPNQKRWFPKISCHFSPLLSPPKPDNLSTTEARTLLTTWLRDTMIRQQFDVEMEFGAPSVLDSVLETARRFPKRVILEDVTRQKMTYRRLITSVTLLADEWASLLDARADRVGVLLPNVNSNPVTILSLWGAGKIPAIFNYSSGMATMLNCAALAGLKQIITSRTFLERFELDPAPFVQAGLEMIYLEDVRARMRGGKKIRAAARVRFRPRSVLLRRPTMESAAVVLFTSGSEGMPKGVELSQGNILANLRQMVTVIDLMDRDKFFNALPLFHSFGLTVGTFLPLVRGVPVFIYPSPLHYRVVPAAVYNLDATVMFGTNTFLNGYARKAHPYDFRTIRYLIAGAEKLQEATATTWMRRFGIRIIEGYGATECSPCLSANTPIAPKHGSAGRFLPAIDWRLEPVAGVDRGGRLFVRGPNIMRRYLNPEANEKFQSLGGWYDTGDIVDVDEEGFVHILGRLKRFAKVSGEMISLAALEEALAGAFAEFGLRTETAVLSRPDEEKGEMLVAVSNEPKITLENIRAVLKQKGFSNLALPRELKVVHELPRLGTGKINHRQLADEVFAADSPAHT
jgi:acyl-[acyl-carrier-protein]-phospholipid O-acyltransferase/long-chain-fatty-acid--[acyl-carrier-protein] ligase